MKNLFVFISILISLIFSFNLFSSENTTLAQLEQILSPANPGVNTDAVIIFKDGTKIFEQYAREYNAETKHLSWSMAKTISGILIGQAIEEGKLSLEDRADIYIPELKSSATIRNILNMSSGIQFKEEYSGIPVDADVTKMLYLNGPKVGMPDFVAALPNRANLKPGDHFYYSSGDANLLMAILKKVTKDSKEYNEYPWKNFFNPLDITNATFEQDANATFIGSSYIYLTANDYLKIGKLIMQNGVWNEKQIIPKDYLALMKEVAPGVQLNALEGTSPTRSYSSQITTNLPISGRGLPSEYSDLPKDALLMIGHQGQLVIASASQHLVIIRLAMDKGSVFDRNKFFNIISQYIKEKGFQYKTVRDETHFNKSTSISLINKTKPKTKISDYLKVPLLIRTLAAKEYCSCLLVVGRSENACKEDLKASLPILPSLVLGHDKKSIKAMFGTDIFQQTVVAEYKNSNLGCTLQLPN